MVPAEQQWIAKSQSEVSRFCRVTVSAVRKWAADGMPGRPGRYDLSEIHAWRLERETRRRAASDDPLLDGGDSPGLERYRQAKAALAELELAERESSLMSREKALTILGRFAAKIRRMGERLGKRFGADAAIMVNESLTECESDLNELGGCETV